MKGAISLTERPPEATKMVAQGNRAAAQVYLDESRRARATGNVVGAAYSADMADRILAVAEALRDRKGDLYPIEHARDSAPDPAQRSAPVDVTSGVQARGLRDLFEEAKVGPRIASGLAARLIDRHRKQ